MDQPQKKMCADMHINLRHRVRSKFQTGKQEQVAVQGHIVAECCGKRAELNAWEQLLQKSKTDI